MEETTTKAETRELREKLEALKQDLCEVTALVKDRLVTGGKEWAKDHPVAAVGIVAAVSAGIGFLIGLLVGRNRN